MVGRELRGCDSTFRFTMVGRPVALTRPDCTTSARHVGGFSKECGPCLVHLVRCGTFESRLPVARAGCSAIIPFLLVHS